MASSSVPDRNPHPPHLTSRLMTLKTSSPGGSNQRREKNFQEFILDTSSRESVISLENLKISFSSAELHPATWIVKCTLHQRIPFLWTTVVQIYPASGKPINNEFHISDGSSYFLIGLKVIRELEVRESLLLSSATALSEEINKLMTTCMVIDPIHLETEGIPIFLKRRILPMDYDNLCVKSGWNYKMRESVMSFTPLFGLHQTWHPWRKMASHRESVVIIEWPLIKCSKIISSQLQKQKTSLTAWSHPNFFSVIDLRNAFLQVPLDEASKQLLQYPHQMVSTDTASSHWVFRLLQLSSKKRWIK